MPTLCSSSWFHRLYHSCTLFYKYRWDRPIVQRPAKYFCLCLSVCLPCHETGLTVEITGSATASIAFDILQNFMAEIHPYLKERKKKTEKWKLRSFSRFKENLSTTFIKKDRKEEGSNCTNESLVTPEETDLDKYPTPTQKTGSSCTQHWPIGMITSRSWSTDARRVEMIWNQYA